MPDTVLVLGTQDGLYHVAMGPTFPKLTYNERSRHQANEYTNK